MAVAPADHVDVNRGPEMNGERLPELLDHLGLERANPPTQRHPVRQIGPLAEVQDDPGQCFIEWRVGVAEPRDSIAVPECRRERLAENDPGVLDQVMRVRSPEPASVRSIAA